MRCAKLLVAGTLALCGTSALSLDEMFNDPAFEDLRNAAKNAVNRFQGFMDGEIREFKEAVQTGELADENLPQRIANKVQDVATEFLQYLRGEAAADDEQTKEAADDEKAVGTGPPPRTEQ